VGLLAAEIPSDQRELGFDLALYPIHFPLPALGDARERPHQQLDRQREQQDGDPVVPHQVMPALEQMTHAEAEQA
jgi:hypothetical protein